MENTSLIVAIPLDRIWDNPYQTRQSIPHEHIGNLASDIRANGLLETPAGRPVDNDGLLIPYREGCTIQLAYGHNRHQAFYLLSGMYAGEYDSLPVKIVNFTDEQMALTAWSENETRKQLNPVERAMAIQHFITSFNWTQQQVAEKVRLERSTVTNLLRLLKLPADILESLAEGVISQRQAIALLPFYDDLTEFEQGRLLGLPDFAEFMQLARSGQVDSDTIRSKVNLGIEMIYPEQTERDIIRDGRLQKDIEGNDVPPVMNQKPDEEIPGKVEENQTARYMGDNPPPLIPGLQPDVPMTEADWEETPEEKERLAGQIAQKTGEPIIAAEPQVIQAAPPSIPLQGEHLEREQPTHPENNTQGRALEGGKTVKSWAESTYTINMGFQPEDGNENGRAVIISVRRDDWTPVFNMTREGSLSLPWQFTKLIQDLHPEDFPSLDPNSGMVGRGLVQEVSHDNL